MAEYCIRCDSSLSFSCVSSRKERPLLLLRLPVQCGRLCALGENRPPQTAGKAKLRTWHQVERTKSIVKLLLSRRQQRPFQRRTIEELNFNLLGRPTKEITLSRRWHIRHICLRIETRSRLKVISNKLAKDDRDFIFMLPSTWHADRHRRSQGANKPPLFLLQVLSDWLAVC